MGINIGYERLSAINNAMQFGYGISYQIPRSVGDNNGAINFTTFYGIAKAYVFNESTYLLGHLGYNMFNADSEYKTNGFFSTENGYYYGIGAGINKKESPFVAEIIYGVNNGSLKGNGYFVYNNTLYPATASVTVKYSKTSLYIGYKF